MATKTSNGTTGKTSAASASASKRKEGVEIDGGFIVITLPLAKKPELSKSGKTFTLASTGGFEWHDDIEYADFETIGVSVNVNGKKG